MTRLLALIALLTLFNVSMGYAASQSQLTPKQIYQYSQAVIFGSAIESEVALDKLVKRGNTDVVPTMVLASRYRRDEATINKAISVLTGEAVTSWKDGMLWQEAHEEVIPHPSYRDLKLEIFRRIDPNFMRFLGGAWSARVHGAHGGDDKGGGGGGAFEHGGLP